jgi:hypothetical protein
MRHEIVGAGKPTVGLLALPHIDPGRGRQKLDVAYGMTIAEMVIVALPDLRARDRIRVSIGDHVIAPEIWHRVRPYHGATVVIRAVPGDDTLRSVLSVVVLVAAVALGQFYAPSLAGGLGLFSSGVTGLGGAAALTPGTLSFFSAMATAGFSLAGTLLLNAFIPVRGLNDQGKGTDIYSITGLQNSSNPGGVIPSILGKHRYAAVYAAPSYTQVIGDDQYCVAAFLFGHGPLALTNLRLGDTPIDNFDDIEIDIRNGYAGDAPITLYPEQVIEDQLSIQLKYNETQTRFTARDVTEAEIDIAFVQGLLKYDKNGNPERWDLGFKVEYRKIGDTAFTEAATVDIASSEQKVLRRSIRWAFPSRGQYEVAVTRLSIDSDDTKVIDRSDWSAIRSFRPESPFNFKQPVCLVALRIRASDQLNGAVNNFNADASLLCRDWDAPTRTWIVRETSNPASLFRHVLQGPANAYPKSDAQIDIAQLQDWHEFCTAKGLKYDRVHDYDATRLDVLRDIAAAGRATPHDDGQKWGVVIDRPQTTYVSSISPRNSWDFQGTTPQVLFPDGHRVQFIDATNGYQQAERIIPFPGVDPSFVAVTEDLSHPGKTDPDEIWRETRRRQYELIHRPHAYTVSQDFEALVLSRGDLAPLNHDVLDRDHVAGRIRSVDGRTIVLDTSVTMEAGRSYACLIRRSDGTVIRRTVLTDAGETCQLRLVGTLTGVQAGDLVSFGTSLRAPAIDVIVKNVERGDNLTATLTLVDAAPIIDQLVDAEVPPAWDGRVGEVVDVPGLPPAVPVIVSIATDDDGTIDVALRPGTGSVAVPTTYVVSHRLHGGGAYSTMTLDVATGVAEISGYLNTDRVDIKAHAVTATGIPSADTDVQVRDGFLSFSSGGANLAPGTSYFGQAGGSTTEADVQFTLSADCVIDRLNVVASLPPGAGQSFAYTLRKNGADTGLACAVYGSSITANDNSHSVVCASGDRINIELVASGASVTTSHRATVRATF